MNWVVDKFSTREAPGHVLTELAEKDNNIYAMGSDCIKTMAFIEMQERFPDRVINVGISEQNLALTAAGIASCGGKPYAASFAPFASMRMLEQIRTFICYPNLNVKILAGLGGLAGGILGATHHGLEDMSLIRSIPNIVLVVPADYCSAREITKKMYEYVGPAYLRLGADPQPKIFDSYSFTIGKANVMKDDGKDLTVITNGQGVHRSLEACEILKGKGIHARIVEMPCVKPIDKEEILRSASLTGIIATVEENNILGGLGGAVCEVTAEEKPVPVLRLGISDIFTESALPAELLDKYGFAPADILRRVARFLGRLPGADRYSE